MLRTYIYITVKYISYLTLIYRFLNFIRIIILNILKIYFLIICDFKYVIMAP